MKHRDYVGPGHIFDFMGALQFFVLVSLGLREYHTMLDIGCGTLRGGKFYIPYLLKERYYGIEPRDWLVSSGIEFEMGKYVVEQKKPTFSYVDNYDVAQFDTTFDYAIAQSIFSHSPLEEVETCINNVGEYLDYRGIFVFTYYTGEEDNEEKKWVYPTCIKYKTDTIREIAKDAGMYFRILDFPHPNGQTWAAVTHHEDSIPSTLYHPKVFK